jgi:predicted transposase YdaD
MRLAPLFHQQQELAKQEGRQEGIQEGIQEGRQKAEQREQLLIIRQLNRRIGEIDLLLLERVRGLSIDKLEELGEALLDFSVISDLETWFAQQEV